MTVLASNVNTQDPQFQANAAHHRQLAEELRDRLSLVRQGGPAHAHKRHAEQDKLFVRERIDRLLDPGSPFLELSPLAAWQMYEGAAPAAGRRPSR